MAQVECLLFSKYKQQPIAIKSSPNIFVEDYSRLIFSIFERYCVYLVMMSIKKIDIITFTHLQMYLLSRS